jgi:hypothetical protein
MQVSLDHLVGKGLQLLDDSGNPSDAHSEHESWVREVHEWLAQAAPNSGLTAAWGAFGSSPLMYGGAYYDEPQAWISHMALVRRRLSWLAEHGPIAARTGESSSRKRTVAKLAALKGNVASAVSFDWSDLHYAGELTLEFFQRYAPLRDELKSLDPHLYSDLPVRELPEIPTVTTTGTIKGHIASRYLKTLLSDIEYILETESQLGRGDAAQTVQLIDFNKDKTVSWDVFISHASEDKTAVAEPLARALMKVGVSVWYDDFTLKVGDSLRVSIEKGLRDSKFGAVILSPAFFVKNWPQKELSALMQKEDGKNKVILPIWYQLTIEDVRKHAPLLADVKALKWGDGIQSVASALLEVINGITMMPGRDVESLKSESLLERATMSPRQTMIEEWQNLEQSIFEAGARNESVIQNSEPLNPTAIVNVLCAARKITKEVREEFFQLKKWHQAVALPDQQYHPEPREAIGFAERTSTLKLKFDSI